MLKRVVIYKAYILICKDAILWNNDKRRFITTRKSMNIKRLDKKGNKLYTLSIPSVVPCHRELFCKQSKRSKGFQCIYKVICYKLMGIES